MPFNVVLVLEIASEAEFNFFPFPKLWNNEEIPTPQKF
jgi:hypothetical protein